MFNCSAPSPEFAVLPLQVPTAAAIEHFDVLLGAVVERLKRAVDAAREDATAFTTSSTPQQTLLRFQTTVVECSEALQQLQATQRYLRG